MTKYWPPPERGTLARQFWNLGVNLWILALLLGIWGLLGILYATGIL